MSDPVDEPVDSEMVAAAAAYMPGSPSDHHHDDSHNQHHDVDGEDDDEEHHEGGDGEGAHGDVDGDAAANSKWSRNGFGAAVPKQVGKFSKQESEGVRKAVEEYCAAKQISTARLCSECDHKVRLCYTVLYTIRYAYSISFMLDSPVVICSNTYRPT
jgi:hypothetical protein